MWERGQQDLFVRSVVSVTQVIHFYFLISYQVYRCFCSSESGFTVLLPFYPVVRHDFRQ